jgi:hypothetical protein
MRYTRNLSKILPLPFRRGEGRGEGSLGAVYPTVLSIRAGIWAFSWTVSRL